MEKCPLCFTYSVEFHKNEFFHCENCNSIFRTKNNLPDFENEKSRYLLHENLEEDRGYVNFLKPVIEEVCKKMKPGSHGLDFGSGPGPVASKILIDKGYEMSVYDPFFENNPLVLDRKYDFIICTEVVEHFHFPSVEFKKLYEILKPGGILFVMTSLWDKQIDFSKWYYKNDFTHVFFYSCETFEWIRKNYRFRKIEFLEKVIRLEK